MAEPHAVIGDAPGWLREEAQRIREAGGPPRGAEAVAVIIERCARLIEERSDLPEGQSKECDLGRWIVDYLRRVGAHDTPRWDIAANDIEARVRTQVAEDVSRALRVEGVDVTDWQRGYRACAERAMAVLGLGREHAGKGFPSTPAALPDVVGTPTQEGDTDGQS